MKSLIVSALVLSLSLPAHAQVFSVEDSQFDQKTYVTVTRTWGNALADEDLTAKIIREAHAQLMTQIYKLNASNQIPEQLVDSEAMQRFNVRKKDMDNFVAKVNKSLAPLREANLKKLEFTGYDLIPDAFILYYPVLKKPYKIMGFAVDTFAVVATAVNQKVYEVSSDPSCKDVSRQEIKEQLQKEEVNQFKGCHIQLVSDTIEPNANVFLMVGVDQNIGGNGTIHPRSAGIGFIWDAKNQMGTARDVGGLWASISIGKLVTMGAGAVGDLYSKIKSSFKKAPKAEVTLSRAANEMVQESLDVNIPNGLDLSVIGGAMKNATNFRAGGIFSERQLKVWPDYYVFTFDLTGKTLESAFKWAVGKNGDAAPTAEVTAGQLKGPPIQISAFALMPLPAIAELIDQGLSSITKANADNKKD